MTTHLLILCTHNSVRSMLQHLAAKATVDVQAHSAGSTPSGRVHPFCAGKHWPRPVSAGVSTAGCRSRSWDPVQLAGAAGGAWLAHAMFETPILQWSA